jgi:hypothetical protein
MLLLKVVAAAALLSLSCVGGAMGDLGSLAAQLDDPLMKEIFGSVRAQLSSLESRVDAERKGAAALQAGMAEKMKALQVDNGAKQAQIDSLVATVEWHTIQIACCVNASGTEKQIGVARQGRDIRQTAAAICRAKGRQAKERWFGCGGEMRLRCILPSTAAEPRRTGGTAAGWRKMLEHVTSRH